MVVSFYQLDHAEILRKKEIFLGLDCVFGDIQQLCILESFLVDKLEFIQKFLLLANQSLRLPYHFYINHSSTIVFIRTIHLYLLFTVNRFYLRTVKAAPGIANIIVVVDEIVFSSWVIVHLTNLIVGGRGATPNVLAGWTLSKFFERIVTSDKTVCFNDDIDLRLI